MFLKKSAIFLVSILMQANLSAGEKELIIDFDNSFKSNLGDQPCFLDGTKLLSNCGIKGGALEIDKDRFGYQHTRYDIPSKLDLRSGTIDLYFMLRRPLKSPKGFTLLALGSDQRKKSLHITVFTDWKQRTKIVVGLYNGEGVKSSISFRSKRPNDLFRWRHVAVSWGKKGLQLFSNGKKVGHKDVDLAKIKFGPELFIPPKSLPKTYGFSLLIDEVRLRTQEISSYPELADLTQASGNTKIQLERNEKTLAKVAKERVEKDLSIPQLNPQVIPVPQKFKKFNYCFDVPATLSVYLNPETQKETAYVIRALQNDLNEIQGKENPVLVQTTNSRDDAHILLLSQLPAGVPANKADEAYSLEVKKEKIVIKGKTPQARFYAILTLLQLFDAVNGKKVFHGAEIIDFPDVNFRAIYFRPRGRTHTKIDQLKRVIDLLSRYKCNHLILQFNGFMKFEKRPEACFSDSYSSSDVSSIVEYAKNRFIKIIPGHQSLGHLKFIYLNSKKYPELKKYFINPKTLDVTNNDIYPFLFDIYDEILKTFPDKPKYFHAGMDEAWGFGKGVSPESHAMLMAKHINKINSYFEKKGIKMMIWNDMLIPPEGISKVTAHGKTTAGAVDMIDKNIVIVDWNYDPQTQFASAKEFIAKGFQTMLTTWRNTQNIYRQSSFAREHNCGIIGSTWIEIAGKTSLYNMSYGNEVLRGHILTLNYAWSSKPEIKRFAVSTQENDFYDYSVFIKGLEPTIKLSTRIGRLAAGRIYTVDISAYCNSSSDFIKPEGMEKFSDGRKDSGIIYRFPEDNNKNTIAVHKDSSLNPNIKVDAEIKEIIFLHCLKKNTDVYRKSKKPIGYYIINYKDGSRVNIPLMNGINIRLYAMHDLATGSSLRSDYDIFGAFGENIPMINGKIWASFLGYDDKIKAPFILQSYAWKNPFPQKQISSISFSSEEDDNITLFALNVIK